MAAIRHLEETVVRAEPIEGIALRYGGFYGPGTSRVEGGEHVEAIRKDLARVEHRPEMLELVRIRGGARRDGRLALDGVSRSAGEPHAGRARGLLRRNRRLTAAEF